MQTTPAIDRKSFDATANLTCSMHEYVLRFALVAQNIERGGIASGYRLAFAQKTGWRFEFMGHVMTSGDAFKVYDVARRSPFNYFLNAGHRLRQEAADHARKVA